MGKVMLYPDMISTKLATAEMETPKLLQLLCTTLQIGMLKVLRDQNVETCSVVGHSKGEIAAAYAAGAIIAEYFIKIAHFRGQVSQSL
ncbi:hypothetical protein N7495_007123 [Penicillium taxi]|uniref:uncharacterized protein n=1 Tax=Penicillium taxi TaxID=168475 RepID=UPI00254523C7|nr:uncharacterized protein N7495_007123 [Penicillium taxi]KAJ5895432.1 hypothetical protein N7495_007123 [Penicillium taxi]